MQRIEVNVQTGEQKVIDLTAAEVADAQARTAAEAIDKAKPKPPTLEDRIAALEAKVK